MANKKDLELVDMSYPKKATKVQSKGNKVSKIQVKSINTKSQKPTK